MTRAPTYPIHRNRRNSISIRFSVRSIRFSRCGPRAVGPRPPASLALGGKEIHYPPRGAESRGSSRSTGPPQPGGWPQGRERTVRGPAQGGSGGDAQGALRDGRRTKHSNARRESWDRTRDPSRDSALLWSGESEACALSIQANLLARFCLGARLNPNDSLT